MISAWDEEACSSFILSNNSIIEGKSIVSDDPRISKKFKTVLNQNILQSIDIVSEHYKIVRFEKHSIHLELRSSF